MRVQAQSLQNMVKLVSKQNVNAPDLLQMLKPVVKVEELDLPLKRNQDYIIKFVTQYWAGICCGLDSSASYRFVFGIDSYCDYKFALGLAYH